MRDRPEFDSTRPGGELTEAEQAEVDAGAQRWLDTNHPVTPIGDARKVDVPPQPLDHPIDTGTATPPEKT